jgi:hypothetical protein
MFFKGLFNTKRNRIKVTDKSKPYCLNCVAKTIGLQANVKKRRLKTSVIFESVIFLMILKTKKRLTKEKSSGIKRNPDSL